MALYLAKIGKCLVSYEFHCSKHVQGIYKVWRVFDPRAGQSGQGIMTLHQVRQGWTNHSRALDPH